MSEYWKSTPKYWCKHCKTFVKDTKLDKTNHDASPKHQGNIKRFLRDLHRGHEREARDKQRAKDEVQRLNKVVAGGSNSFEGAAGGGGDPSGAPWRRTPAIPLPSANTLRQATPADRRQQLAQLAEMGVAIPEDLRKEMAMVGDWQTLSEMPIDETRGRKKEEENGDHKSEALNVGVRKRKFEGIEDEEEDLVVRKVWGSTTRAYPGQVEENLDSLLGKTKMNLDVKGRSLTQFEERTQKALAEKHGQQDIPQSAPEENPSIKKEDSADEKPATSLPLDTDVNIKPEDAPDPAIMFKKRRSKQTRQK